MIGLSKTLELVLMPKTYGAQEALEMGLVNRVVPDDRLTDEAMEVATVISKRPPFAIQKAKETIYQNLDRHWLEALQVEMAVFVECMSTAEHREGIRAFLESERPISRDWIRGRRARLDLRDSPAEAAFRKEVIAFIEAEAPRSEPGVTFEQLAAKVRAGSSSWRSAAGSRRPGRRSTAARA